MSSSESAVDLLKKQYPWPHNQPKTGVPLQGWLGKGNIDLLEKHINSKTRVIVELGSWLGKSAIFFAKKAKNATIIAIDHWEGSIEHQTNSENNKLLPLLYDSFLMHVWPYKNRVIPLRTDSITGMEVVNKTGIQPDIVYVDASHETEDVFNDIQMARNLFPHAILIGDDWKWESVKVAVRKYAKENGLSIQTLENCWHLTSPKDLSMGYRAWVLWKKAVYFADRNFWKLYSKLKRRSSRS